jgi:hypothetical protein
LMENVRGKIANRTGKPKKIVISTNGRNLLRQTSMQQKFSHMRSR